MPRWEPNARSRLLQAAVELFEERGYDGTGVKEIAQRAGLTKTTFFRHFSDKREVLAAGQEEHSVLLADAVARQPQSAEPLQTVEAALLELAATFPPQRRAFSARVHAITESNDDLRERAGLKHEGYVSAMRAALTERHVPKTTADVAATLGLLAFRAAFERWTTSEAATLQDLVREEMRAVRDAATSLAAAPAESDDSSVGLGPGHIQR